MKSHWHKVSYKKIASLSEIPDVNSYEYLKWISGERHLKFLRQNAAEDELIIFASANSVLVRSLVIPNKNLKPKVDIEDLLKWSLRPYDNTANYTWTLGKNKEVWIETGTHCAGAKSLENGHPLVYGRIFDGWSGTDKHYLEIHQEYTHLANIHWRQEHGGYCQFDENGDIENAISVSSHTDQKKVEFVSFSRRQLEEYLAVSDSALIQLFDFTMFNSNCFPGWSGQEAEVIEDKENLAYKQKINEMAGYCRGVQIITPKRSRSEIFTVLCSDFGIGDNKQYASFLIDDWRNKSITEVSAEPSATTNYFQTENNSLPFELSPAFFRSEVLAKYKSDSDKYTIEDRQIFCRATWSLRYDVNEAKQVHAYLCDLRHLPYSEQTYWKSFNESPKASISRRAIENDFLNQRTDQIPPLQRILIRLRNWDVQKHCFWKLLSKDLLNKVSTPYTNGRDEWGREFLNLSKLIIEGFNISYIRSLLDEHSIAYDGDEKSLALIEKVLDSISSQRSGCRLNGLRESQLIRNKLGAHASQKTANSLAQNAQKKHGSFTEHFNKVCDSIVNELQIIEEAMEQMIPPRSSRYVTDLRIKTSPENAAKMLLKGGASPRPETRKSSRLE